MNTDRIINANFKYAGALLDVNLLIRNGWIKLTDISEEGEWKLSGSTWVGLVDVIDGLEYHIAVAFGDVLERNEEKGTFKISSTQTVLDAYKGNVPRMSFLRYVQCWVFNHDLMRFEEYMVIPTELLDRICSDLEGAVIRPNRKFLEDLTYQTRGYEYLSPERRGSLLEQKMYIHNALVKKEVNSRCIDSVKRLLTPFARAMLGDDEEGRRSVMEIDDVQIVENIAEASGRINFYEGLAACADLVLKKSIREKINAYTISNIFVSGTNAAYHKSMPKILSLLFDRIREIGDRKVREDLCEMISRQLIIIGNEIPIDTDSFHIINDSLSHRHMWGKLRESSRETIKIYLEVVENNIDVFEGEMLPRLWAAVARLYVDKRDGDEITSGDVKHIEALLNEAVAKKDKDASDFLKAVPIGIKCPLEHQALLYSYSGLFKNVLKSLPYPVSVAIHNIKDFPPLVREYGLMDNHIWEPLGIDEKLLEEYIERRRQEIQNFEDCRRGAAKWFQEPMLFTHSEDVFRYFIETKEKYTSELSLLFLKGVKRDESDRIITIFPFFAKENPINKANTIAKIWEYYRWNDAVSADVRFSTELGKMLYAVMPYYIGDSVELKTGMKYSALVVGFLSSISKEKNLSSAAILDDYSNMMYEEENIVVDYTEVNGTFTQDVISPYLNHSMFDMTGKVRSIRELKAFDVEQLAIEIECSELDKPLLCYTAKTNVKEEIKVGDFIKASGWLYFDAFEQAESNEDFRLRNLACNPKDPRLPYPSSANNCFVFLKTEFTKEERNRLPDHVLNPDLYEIALRKLESLPKVLRVEMCETNPLGVEYLVNVGGKVEKYHLTIRKGTKEPERQFWGVNIFYMNLQKSKYGYDVSWEFPESLLK